LLNNLVNSVIALIRKKKMAEQKAFRKKFFRGITIPFE